MLAVLSACEAESTAVPPGIFEATGAPAFATRPSSQQPRVAPTPTPAVTPLAAGSPQPVSTQPLCYTYSRSQNDWIVADSTLADCAQGVANAGPMFQSGFAYGIWIDRWFKYDPHDNTVSWLETGDFQAYLDLALLSIDHYSSKVVSYYNETYTSPAGVIPYPSASPVDTPCGVTRSGNADYCAANSVIYYDSDFLKQQATASWFIPVAILAHEWGHLIQGQLGLSLDTSKNIDLELNADCLSGAYAHYYSTEEKDAIAYEKADVTKALQLIYASGDPASMPWYDPQAHGSPQQRHDYFLAGYNSGFTSCFQ
jgi:uncharacterized protein